MTPGLLALVFVAAVPQAGDPTLSDRLRLEAQERQAVLDLDSAVVLLRAARDADPANLVAHLEYIGLALRRQPGGVVSLRAEYAALPPSPLHTCLTAYLAVARFNLPAAAPALLRMEADGTGAGCPTVLLSEIVGDMVPRRTWEPRRLAYLQGALSVAPDAWWLWMGYASALAAVAKFEEAEATLTEALTRFPHPLRMLRLQLRRASIHRQRGDSASAVALSRAVAQAVARDGRAGLRAEYLRALDEVLSRTNEEGNPLDPFLREGARLAQQQGAWEYEWRFRYSLALRLTDRGRALAAIPEYTRLVEIADSVGNPTYQIPAYMKRGRALERLGRLAEAEASLLDAIRVGTGAGHPYWLAESYHNLAEVYESTGRLPEASWAADRFIEIIRPLEHSPLRMTAFRVAGEIRWTAGWHAAARRALDSMVAVIDHQEQNRYFAGEHFERTGDLGTAKRYYSAAVADGEDLSRNLGGLVRVYRSLGQLDSAEHAARQHDRILAEERDVPLLPEVLAERGAFDRAVQASAAWAEKRLADRNVGGAAAAHLQWAGLLLQSGQAATAIPILDRVDSLAAIRSLTRAAVEATRLRGLALAALGREHEALTVLEEAAWLARAHPTAATVVATHVSLGEALAAAGRPFDALDVFDTAASQAHVIAGSLEEDIDRVRHRGRNMAPFDGAIRVLLRLPDSEKTVRRLLEWSQRRKAAALALATAGATGAAPRMRPLSLAEIWTRLVPSEALIDYLVTDGAVAAVVVTRGRVSLHRLQMAADTLGRLVRELRKPLAVTFNGRVDLARARFPLDLSQRLHAALISPLLTELGGVTRLFVVPDGVLHFVPFTALVSSVRTLDVDDAYSAARYLLDDFETAYLPSVALLPPDRHVGLRSLASDARILAMTYRAPGGEREVRAIAAVLGEGAVRRLEGDAATESAVQDAGSNYGVLHFAVHAIANDEDPLASFLRLAPAAGTDGLLHLSEIAAQTHTGQLVVLSGCETQMGRLYYGEGIMGLTRAFLATEAAGVVATHWPVGAAAADLMTAFYHSLSSRTDPVTALREAQLRLRNDPRTSHPFYWAAFGLHLGT